MTALALVVDDELHIRRLLRRVLERGGYQVEEAESAAGALAAAARVRPAVVVLDLGLPDRDGLELIAPLKAAGDPALLVVSAREATEEKVSALDLGADDFVTKPFDGDELLARVRAALRGPGRPTAPPVLKGAGLEIDLERRLVRRESEAHRLTRKEHAILSALAAAPGRVVTHQRLLEAGWEHEWERHIEYLRLAIRGLRQKVEPPGAVGSVITNELGVGYRLLLGD